MKYKKLILFLIFVFTTLPTVGCHEYISGKDESLPPDPQDWVCQDSVINLSEREINKWCMNNTDRGQPAPLDLRVPPPLADLAMKNIYDIALENFLRGFEYVDLGWKHDLNWKRSSIIICQGKSKCHNCCKKRKQTG